MGYQKVVIMNQKKPFYSKLGLPLLKILEIGVYEGVLQKKHGILELIQKNYFQK